MNDFDMARAIAHERARTLSYVLEPIFKYWGWEWTDGTPSRADIESCFCEWIERLRPMEVGEYWYISSGRLFLLARRFEDDGYEITMGLAP